jgi:hypothetical protein
VDPRRWDLNQLLAAYLVTLKQGCKDEAAWHRLEQQLTAEPMEVRKARLEAQMKARQQALKDRLARPQAGAITLDDAEAMLARMAAQDAQYG